MSVTAALYQTCRSPNTPKTIACTPETCCLANGFMNYLPSLAGNALYMAIFSLLLFVNLLFGIRYKTTTFTIWMSLGLIGEAVGYVGRIMLHNNIFSFNAFLIYLVPLTIAPAFVTACIYLCLARIISIMDPNLTYTRLKPKIYTTIFVTFDFIALVLQGAGGGITSTGNDTTTDLLGVNVMIAGLAFQIFSLVVFIALCSDFAWRFYRASGTGSAPSSGPMLENNSTYVLLDKNETSISTTPTLATLDHVRRSRMFKGLILALACATILILIRSCYRLAELRGGFHGTLANNEVLFMILEGLMIIISVLLLNIFHPGFSLGKHHLWNMKAFQSQMK